MPVQLELVPENPSAASSSFELVEGSSEAGLVVLRSESPVKLSSDSELVYYEKKTGNFLYITYVESGMFEKTKFCARVSEKFPLPQPSALSLPSEDGFETFSSCTWKFIGDTIFLQIGNFSPQPAAWPEFHKGVFSKRVKLHLRFPTPASLHLDGALFHAGSLTFQSPEDSEISDRHELHLSNESGSVNGVLWFLVRSEVGGGNFLSLRLDYPGDGLAAVFGTSFPSDLPAASLAEYSAISGVSVRRRGGRTLELDVDVAGLQSDAPASLARASAAASAAIVAVAAPQAEEPSLLDRTRPKDALAGVTSGLKAVGGGLLAGTAALVLAPVAEVQEKGAVGVFAGLAKGVGGFLGLGLGGAVAGVSQVVRGLVNTPEALRQAASGGAHVKWDKETGQWVDQRVDLARLRREFAAPAAAGGAAGGAARGAKRPVKDRRLYDVLGVEPEASADEVKKAYRRKALALHPDKLQPGTAGPAAGAGAGAGAGSSGSLGGGGFLEVSQAYQVLGEAERRRAYDARGMEAVETQGGGAEQLDPRIFFSALFGGEKFHKYTGDLALASEAATLLKEEGASEAEQSFAARRRAKLRREVLSAGHVLERLETLVERRDERGFLKETVEEALELAKEKFGPELLETIGFAYENRARQWLLECQGERIERKWTSWKSTGKALGRKATMVGSIAKAAVAAKRMHAAVEHANEAAEKAGGETSEAANEAAAHLQELLAESVPQFLATVWDVSVVDIAKHSKAVAKKILLDLSVPWQTLWRRAKALETLGRLWRGVGAARLQDSKADIADVEKAIFSSIRR